MVQGKSGFSPAIPEKAGLMILKLTLYYITEKNKKNPRSLKKRGMIF